MNFLEICQEAWVEAGQSGAFASTTATSDFQKRFVSYVRKAWLDIQKESDQWSFMKSNDVVSIAANVESQSLALLGITDCRIPLKVYIFLNGQWVPLPFEISAGVESLVDFQNKATKQPSKLFFDGGMISFDSIPDQVYQLKIYYTQTPQELRANTDTPSCASMYHHAIVWGAVKSYALDDSDQVLLKRADDEHKKCLMEMKRDLTPKIRFRRSEFTCR